MKKIEIDIDNDDEAGLIMRKFGYIWFLWGIGAGIILGFFIGSLVMTIFN